MTGVGAPPFAPVEFGAFHADEVPGLLAAHADVLAHRPDDLEPLTVEVGGDSVTYRIADDGVEVVEGVRGPRTHVRLSPEAWSDFAHQHRSTFGLDYAGLLDCVTGRSEGLGRWEPTLRAVWAGQDPSLPDVETCPPGTPLEEQLATQGFALVRDVFSPDEVEALRAEVDRLTPLARPGDQRSWWARTAEGDEVCCRLLYTEERSDVIPEIALGDGRLAELVGAMGESVRVADDRFDGLAVVMKPPGVVEGLSDLPWHRDCGLGGHSIMCPLLNVGIQLDAATPDTGQLEFLPGSHASAWWPRDQQAVDGRPTVAVDTQPGDVTVHYGHVLHRAGPPAGVGGRRSMYATFVQEHAFDYIGPRQAVNDVLMGTSEVGIFDDRGTAG
jgi:Phytanoyl-CoA dioxygenase (PhyH)